MANASIMTEGKPDTSKMTFEQALSALDEIVKRLESGEVPLDDSIDLYEQGEKLRQLCQARLDSAQARIQKIITGPDGDAVSTAPFDSET